MFGFESEKYESPKIFLSVKDKDLKFTYCNENVLQSLGFSSSKQIIGKTDYDLFTNNIADDYRSGDQYVLKGGLFLNVREIHPYGNEIIHILTTKIPLKKKSSSLAGIVISYIDITELMQDWPSNNMQYDHESKLYKIQVGKKTEFFTQREYLILKNILKGFTAKRIAKQLSLSPRTVEDYINKIKYKLNCSSKNNIIEEAMRLGILQQNIINNIS